MKNTRGMKISRSSAIGIILVAAVITVGITIALFGMVQSDKKEQELPDAVRDKRDNLVGTNTR